VFQCAFVRPDQRAQSARIQKLELREVNDDIVLALVGRFQHSRAQ